MTLATTVAVILWVGVTAYAVLGGADFGSGFWDLTAGGDRRGARPRALIDLAIGPVWEANHVWLIFCLVVLWTGFPTAFAAITTTLYIPLGLAALGIVARGSGFAFRHVTTRLSERRLFGAVFAISSVVTPFFLGTVAGAIASGRVPAGGDASAGLEAWVNPTSLLCGVLAVTTCAYLAAVFLVHDAERHGVPELRDYFVRRAVGAGLAAGAVAAVGLVVVRRDAPMLYEGLTGRDALGLLALSAACGLTTLVLLARLRGRESRALGAIRLLAVGAVATVVWGWGVAQDPYLLPPEVTIADAAGADPTLWSILVVLGIATVTIFPAMVLLYRLDQRGVLEPGDLEAETAANRGDG